MSGGARHFCIGSDTNTVFIFLQFDVAARLRERGWIVPAYNGACIIFIKLILYIPVGSGVGMY
jgi:hypothetical protein